MKLQIFSIFVLLITMTRTMPQSLEEGKNQAPIKVTSQFVVEYMANLLRKTADVNFPDMPENLKKLPISQLTNCVTKMHHAILDVCILDIDDPTLPLNDRGLNVLECAFETVAAYDSAKKTVNKANLKEAFIGMTSLTEDKKKSAGLYADRCLAQEKLYLPKFMSNHRALGKAIGCVSKALLKNDCHSAPLQ